LNAMSFREDLQRLRRIFFRSAAAAMGFSLPDYSDIVSPL